MQLVPITREDIDELLAYLPRFQNQDRGAIVGWIGGEQLPDGSITMVHPEYEDGIVSFFMLAGKPCWCDYGYQPARAACMVRDDDLIARASLDQVRTMLTYCVRGERFCDGHWEAMLREGRIARLLERLAVLRESTLP